MASEKNLNLKNEIVNEIKDKVNNSKTMVIVDYKGVTVSDISELRRELRKNSSDVKVYKNTLVRRALNELGHDLDAFLEGPNAFVFGEDIIEPIKTVDGFITKNKKMSIVSGIIEGKIVDADVIKEYATIPSYEGLLTMFAGGLMQHVRNFAIGLDLYAKEKEEN
ncbi:MAG: 50S ribosomal protein L10 [Mollicutes bacterium]|jgi:large subunit ribosomal protein L10|nr:50S ribosomal protein L10 [Mollicutes bacterium]